MAFTTKEWKDRLVEFAGRRKLKNVTTGAETVFDVSRSEGAVSQAGDAFSAANMNNLEQRIKNEFDTVNGSLKNKIILHVTLTEISANAVLKYLVSVPDYKSKSYNGGLSFNVLVNGADFFSGELYSDDGAMYWGIIMQRGAGDINTYAFNINSGGADAVLKKLANSMSLLNYVHANMRGDYAPTIFTLKDETQVAVIMASSSDTEPVLNISGAYAFVHGITSVRSNDGRDPGNLPWTKSCVIKRISAGSITIYGGGNGYWWGGQFAFAEFG